MSILWREWVVVCSERVTICHSGEGKPSHTRTDCVNSLASIDVGHFEYLMSWWLFASMVESLGVRIDRYKQELVSILGLDARTAVSPGFGNWHLP